MALGRSGGAGGMGGIRTTGLGQRPTLACRATPLTLVTTTMTRAWKVARILSRWMTISLLTEARCVLLLAVPQKTISRFENWICR